jgi:hypothetical protein
MRQQQLEKELQNTIEDLLRSCMKGQLSVADYTSMRERLVEEHTQRIANPDQALPLIVPSLPQAPVPVRTRSYSPSKKSESVQKFISTPHVERILGLHGATHRNPFVVGATWNLQHQKILKSQNPQLARTLQAQALNRHEATQTIHLPETLHNPWMYGPHYSLALQSQITKANPELALRMQAECAHQGQW